jgi:hypothetical protein
MENNNSVQINKGVSVVAFYFKNAGQRLKCFPKRMEYNGKSVNFTETGLLHPTQKGHRLVHVFDMTDGSADYRLEFDAQTLDWTLVSISDAFLPEIQSSSSQPAFA